MGFEFSTLPSDYEFALPGSSVVLRRVNAENFENMWQLLNNNRQELHPLNPGITAEKPTSEELYAIKVEGRSAVPTIHFGIWDSEELVGHIYLREQQRDVIGNTHVPSADKKEIGFFIDKSRYGRGYATEGVRAITEFAFNVLGVEVVTALVKETNPASARVLQKASFEHVDNVKIKDLPESFGINWLFARERDSS
ncbi:MAG TPA: GNAT family N-acetyltransferase [Candidatus Saccharimonadales bacterium]|nr:GNAT family N-acetyltransferase [Candidatus Saccharimonadales bacterium]